MPTLQHQYTHPKTGETLTTSQWCQKLGINRATFISRKQTHGLTAKTFLPNSQKKKAQPWEDWELDFLQEAYPDPLWTTKAISAKLERKSDQIRLKAQSMGFKSSQRRTPAHNWLHIWNMHLEGLSDRAISRVIETNHATVGYAIKKISSMSVDERAIYWVTCGYRKP